MRYLRIAAILSLLFITNAYVDEKESSVTPKISPEVKEDKKEIQIAKPSATPEPAEESLKSVKRDEIVVSKDNVIPILRTIVLAFTHKKDPAYEEILKVGGKSLFKLAEKKIGDDKHMLGLLNIIKKYVVDFTSEEMSDEESEILGDLAEKYLKAHKFKFMFPESLLLHQPEMEAVLAKKKELGDIEGRQLKFDFSPYLGKISELTTNMRNIIQKLPFFSNLNLERIGNTFSSFGSTIDEYIPALRTGTGITDFGISVGSLTALAAAGALISAPFFLTNFGASAREDDEPVMYMTNRRAGTGGFPHEQFIDNQDGKPADIKSPEWLNEYEEKRVYNPKVNPHYSEPTFSLHATPQPSYDPQTAKDDEAYNKYLNEYNQWLQQYHNALNQQGGPSKEYEEYYKNYREWYAQYYNEQFGEAPPQQYQQIAPNAYEENNNIANMLPPPNQQQYQQQPIQPQYQQQPTQQQYQQPQNQQQYQQPPNQQQYQQPQNQQQYQQPQNQQHYQQQNENENERSTFQVIHVEENNRYQPAPAVEQDQVADGSARIDHQAPAPAVYHPNVNYHYSNPSPRPVYKPTVQPIRPSTESGFKPLPGEDNAEPDHTVFMFKKNENENESEKTPKDTKIERVDDKFSGFSSIKSISIFKPPGKDESPVDNRPKFVPENKTQAKLSPVTSGVFRTTSSTTPLADTTPTPVYKKPINQSVRVVTSTSVVTSTPFAKSSKPQENNKKEFKKRKITLTELLQTQNSHPPTIPEKKKAEVTPQIEERIDNNVIEGIQDRRIPEVSKPAILAPGEEDLPVYALDPFYGPRLSRTDAIFHQLSLDAESCREQVVCNMYKNPNAYTPLSDFLSRQLTVTYDQLKRPAVNDDRILRFFRYLQAARAGQDSFNCVERYPDCDIDTTKLSYKPIVNAYKKVSVLMNAAGS